MTEKTILHDRVREALDDAGAEYETLACEEHLADTAEFCAHYGISPDEACNALLVVLKTTPRSYVACLVRADTRLDVNRKLADITGVKRMSFASGEDTVALTGQQIGGVSVAGLPAGIPLYIDERVMDRERVIIGGGNRTSKARLAPAELIKLPNASVADIALPR